MATNDLGKSFANEYPWHQCHPWPEVPKSEWVVFSVSAAFGNAESPTSSNRLVWVGAGEVEKLAPPIAGESPPPSVISVKSVVIPLLAALPLSEEFRQELLAARTGTFLTAYYGAERREGLAGLDQGWQGF
jgi:hypothetical protein